MRHLSLLIAALTACASVLPAADPVFPAAPAEADVVVEIDVAALRAQAGQAAVVSIFVDPQASAWRAHLLAQWALLTHTDSEVPPFAAWLMESVRHLYVGEFPAFAATIDPWAEPRRRRDMPSLAFVGDMAAAAPVTQQWLSLMQPDQGSSEAVQRATLAGIEGWQINSDTSGFYGQGERVFIGGQVALLTRVLAGGPAEPLAPGRVASVRAALAGVMRRMQQQLDNEPAGLTALEALAPGLFTAAPTMSASLDIGESGWESEVHLRGLRRPAYLGQLSDAFAAKAPADAEILAAVAVDIPATLALVRSLAPLERDIARSLEMLEVSVTQLSGSNLDALAGNFDGQVLMTATWGGVPMPIPRAGVVLGLRQGAPIAELLGRLLPTLPGVQAANIEGALAAWTLALPMGTLTVVVDEQQLVAATDAQVLARLRQGGEDSPIRGGQEAVLQVRLRDIGATWLPMAALFTAGLRQPIGGDPSSMLRSLTWSIRNEADSADVAAATPVATSTILTTIHPFAQRRLKALFPTDVAAALDASVALYHSAEDARYTVIMPTTLGWLVVDNRSWGEQDLLDANALTQRLAGLTRRYGKEPGELTPVTLPERAVLDARVMPPLPAMVAALPELWSVDMTWRDEHWMVRERGLPLMAVYAGGLAMVLPPMVSALDGSRAWQERSRIEAKLREEHPQIVAALQQVGQAVRRARQTGSELTRVSELIDHGLRLDALAPLFGGVIPAEAAQLDTRGRFNADDDDQVWIIRVDERWAAVVSQWGQVSFLPAPADLPAVQVGVPVGGADDLF